MDLGIPTVSLELVKLIINNVLSIRNAKFAGFNIKKFYLGTAIDRFEYVRVKLNYISKEFFNE